MMLAELAPTLVGMSIILGVLVFAIVVTSINDRSKKQ